jgi:hypothetical protein
MTVHDHAWLLVTSDDGHFDSIHNNAAALAMNGQL